MQAKDAEDLSEKWEEKGDKPRTDPALEKEYLLGVQTGDYICSTCGYTATKGTFNRLRAQAKGAH